MTGNKRLEVLLSLVLVSGVITSLAVLSIALALYYLRFGQEIIMSDEYRIVSGNFFEYLPTIGRHGFSATALMSAGIIILMLTPYVRVLTSMAYFTSERDFKYMLITAFVLAVLTASLLTH